MKKARKDNLGLLINYSLFSIDVLDTGKREEIPTIEAISHSFFRFTAVVVIHSVGTICFSSREKKEENGTQSRKREEKVIPDMMATTSSTASFFAVNVSYALQSERKRSEKYF